MNNRSDTAPMEDDVNTQTPVENTEEQDPSVAPKESVVALISMEETIAIDTAVTMKAEASALQTLIRTGLNAVFGTTATLPVDIHSTRKVFDKTDTSDMSFNEKYFKGFKLNLYSNLLRGGVLFSTMPILQKQLQKILKPEQKALVDLLAFAGASITEAVVFTPFSLANLRMRLNPEVQTYKQALNQEAYPHTMKAIVKGAFWGGMRNFIFSAPFFYLLKEGEARFINEDDSHGMRILKTIGIGAGAGIFPSLLSYPANIMQQRAMDKPELSNLKLLKNLWEEGGMKSLWKGSSLIPVRMAAYTAGLGGAWATGDYIYHKMIPDNFFKKQSPLMFFKTQTAHLKAAAKKASICPTEKQVMRELGESATRPW